MPTPLVKPEYARSVARWLFACAGLVALMVLLGGYTRLSGSGLSITEWKPVHGTLPPLSASAWQEEFAAYQHSPQYQQVNAGMSLAEFKAIYWPEYLHRLLGRLVGVAFFIPLLWFAARRAFTAAFTCRMAGIFALGGLQGLVGWYMVKSGLAHDPQVSPYRLATHLGLAFALLGLLLWSALDVTSHQSRSDKPLLCIFLLLCAQLLLGALLAGFHGGLIYNTFPTMNGAWLPPPDLLARLQFAHRWLAVIIILSIVFWWLKHPRSGIARALALTALLQVGLGIATLLHQAPLPLALTHQTVGVLLFALTVIALHGLTHAETR